MVHAPPRPPAGAPPVRINLYSDTQTRPTPAMLEAMTRAEVGDDQKFGYEQRGSQTIRTYSREFSKAYHARLNGQVERQLRYAAGLIGDFWFTCWVDGGSPDLSKLARLPSEAEQQRLAREAKETAAAPVAGSAPGHDD